jgi:predicted nucleic acid-binding protein
MMFAYWLEDHPKYGGRVQDIYEAMSVRGDRLCSSQFALGELLVGPLQLNEEAAADAIEAFFLSDAVTLLPYPHQAVRTFAQLRARDGIKALDALHLAVAASAEVDLFLTNDRRLHRLVVPGIRFIATLETDLF